MKLTVGISNRHVHLTEEDYQILFNGIELTKRNDLKQPNEYASNLEVTISGPKNKIEKVRVLAPFRDYTQVEVTKTDSYKLGINPPVKTSGDLNEAAEIKIIGPTGSIIRKSVIIATRHIHISEEDLIKYHLNKNKLYKVKIFGEKGSTLENVHLKLRPNAYFELHLDTDDANACLLNQNDEVEIIE